MYKTLNLNAAFALAAVATATVARVKVQDGALMVRFTDRTNTSNLPKGEQLLPVGVKGNGRRLGLKSDLSDAVGQPGTKVQMIAGKYGWFTVAPTEDAAAINGSVGA